MSLNERDVRVLCDLYRCTELTTATIHETHFEGKCKRKTRKTMQRLKQVGLLYSKQVVIGKPWDLAIINAWGLTREGKDLVKKELLVS